MTDVAKVWEEFVPRDELDMYAARGFGTPLEPGRQAALLVIDVVMTFLGPRPGEPGPVPATACGEMGYSRLPNIRRLIDAARRSSVPVVFTKGSVNDRKYCGGSTKMEADAAISEAIHNTTIPAEIEPLPSEWVLEKTKASVFQATPLASYLIRNRIDTLVVCGVSTSGCVRASVVDAASENFRVFLVEEACFDRSRFAHAANLFDIQQKYGDVIDLATGINLLTGSLLLKKFTSK